MAKKMALGRGLGALIEDADTLKQKDVTRPEVVRVESVNEIDIDSIAVNPYQPRTSFDEEALQELSESIKKLGIIQPITVRKLGNEYQLIAGERRLRAAKLAGLTTVPAFVRTADDQGMLEMALVENIQREDLDAIEVAISYQRLIDECELTHDSLSDRVGKKRATVTNYLRLLKLPAEIQMGIRLSKLTMGHARAILSLEETAMQLKAYEIVVDQELSVRKTEELVKRLTAVPEPIGTGDKPADEEQEDLDELEAKLQEILGWGVQIKQGKKGGGKIVISYRSSGELDELMERIDSLAK